MPSCAVKTCQNRPGRSPPGVTFHTLPRDPVSRQAWLDGIGRSDWQCSGHSLVCSDHFDEADLYHSTKLQLKPGAVPVFSKGKQRFPEILDNGPPSSGKLPTCAVIGCICANNRCPPGITFFKFPKDEDLKKVWLYAIGRSGWEPSITNIVCSNHFRDDDLDRQCIIRTFVKPGAVPSLYKGKSSCATKECDTSVISPVISSSQNTVGENLPESDCKTEFIVPCQIDNIYPSSSTSSQTVIPFQSNLIIIKKLQKKCKVLQQAKRRHLRIIAHQRNLLKEVREELIMKEKKEKRRERTEKVRKERMARQKQIRKEKMKERMKKMKELRQQKIKDFKEKEKLKRGGGMRNMDLKQKEEVDNAIDQLCELEAMVENGCQTDV